MHKPMCTGMQIQMNVQAHTPHMPLLFSLIRRHLRFVCSKRQERAWRHPKLNPLFAAESGRVALTI